VLANPGCCSHGDRSIVSRITFCVVAVQQNPVSLDRVDNHHVRWKLPIRREGDFLINHDGRYGPSLGLESDRLSDCIGEVRARGYRSVFGHPMFGFTEPTLDVLRELPPLDAIWFWDVALTDIAGLYAQPSLKKMGALEKRPAIDFGRLPALECLVLCFQPKDTNLDSVAGLVDLHVWRYRAKHKTLAGLALPPNLRTLEFNWANIESLDGLCHLASLREFEAHRCRNLSKLDHLADAAPHLTKLVISASGRVDSDSAERVVSRLPSLQHAWVKDRLYVSSARAAV
jgi:hypothetical protein